MTDKLELKSSHEVVDTVNVVDVDSIFYCKPTDQDILTVLMKDGKRLYCDEVCPIDSLPNEPVSKDLEEEIEEYWKNAPTGTVYFPMWEYFQIIAHHFAEWGKKQAEIEIQAQSMAVTHGCPKEEPVSEELEKVALEYATHYDKNWSEGKDRYIAENEVEAFKAGAQWQKQQMEVYRIKHCNNITNEQAELESDFVSKHVEKNNRMPTFLDAIEYGMELQKQQMMEETVNGEITKISPNDHLRVISDVLPLKDESEWGTKVKLKIIKESR